MTMTATAEVYAEGEPAQEDIAAMARLYYDPELAERSIAATGPSRASASSSGRVRVYIHGDPR